MASGNNERANLSLNSPSEVSAIGGHLRSSLGKNQGLADANTESWWTWLAEMTDMDYDFTFLENAPHPKPRDMFYDNMCAKNEVVSIMTGPEEP